MTKRSFIFILAALLLIGGVLRFTGIQWGFPLRLHFDEHLITNNTATMFRTGSLDPLNYVHPNLISDYLSGIAYATLSRIVFRLPVSLAFHAHLNYFTTVSRATTAILGTLMILVAYAVGSRYRRSMGLYAATLFAVFGPFVQHAHFATADIPLTLYILCSLYFTIRYAEKPSRTTLYLASAFVAIAFSEKYPGILAGIPLACVMLLANRKNWKSAIRTFLEAAIVFLVVLFLFFPWIFLKPGTIYSSLLNDNNPIARHRHLQSIPSWWSNIWFYIKFGCESLGWATLILSIVGCVWGTAKYRWRFLPLFFGIPYLLLMCFSIFRFERYELPMFLTPLLLGAYGLTVLQDYVMKVMKRSQKHRILLRNLWIAFVAFSIGGFFINALAISLTFTLPHTLVLSANYVSQNGITAHNTFYEGYTPFDHYPTNHFGNMDKLNPRIRYVMVSSNMYNRFLKDPMLFPEQNAWYSAVFQLPLVKQFQSLGSSTPGDDETSAGIGRILKIIFHPKESFQGPTIKIFAVPKAMIGA